MSLSPNNLDTMEVNRDNLSGYATADGVVSRGSGEDAADKFNGETPNDFIVDPKEQQPGTTRDLGFYSSLSLLVGLVVGSGIFSSPGPVYEELGTFYGSVLMWVIGGILSLLGAFSYGELGATYPKAGGEHVYLYKAFGSLFSFLFSFTGWVTRPTSVSVISLALCEYILSLVYGKEVADTLTWETVGLSILIIVLTTIALVLSNQSSKWVQNTLCVLKIGLLVFICFTGLYFLIKNNFSLADTVKGVDNPYEDAIATGKVGKVAKGLYLALWGYDGWSNINLVAEKIMRPSRNIPAVMGVGISMIAFFYVLTNVSYFSVITSSELTGVNAISAFAQEAYGTVGRVIILILVCFSAYGALNSTVYCNAEVPLVAAEDKYAPSFLCKLHPKLKTPANVLILQGVISIIISLIFRKDYGSLVTFFSLPFWVFYAGSSASLIHLRKKDPHAIRPFKIPLFVPVIFVISTVFMIVFSFFEAPYECIASILLFVLGVAFWYIFVHRSMRFVVLHDSKIPKLRTVEGIYTKRN